MNEYLLRRRNFLRLSVFAGLNIIAGCGQNVSKQFLVASPEVLPKQLLRALPPTWSYKPIKAPTSKDIFQDVLVNNADFLAIGDGWLGRLPTDKFRKISYPSIYNKLNFLAKDFLSSLEIDISDRILPIAFSPWVMLFRNGEEWLKDAKERWDVLLDPRLEKEIILPSSPRLVMSISDRLSSRGGLSKLRSQALTFDDRNAINWILNKDAKVAVLPLNQCLKTARIDPRLSIALPKQGAPLNWTLLASSKTSKEPLPISWIERVWSPPLLGNLIADGWIPPVAKEDIQAQISKVPFEYREIVLQTEEFWSQCWSLPPISQVQVQKLEKRWFESTP